MICDEAIQDWTPLVNHCPRCGKLVESVKRDQVFCSMRCYRAAGSKYDARPPSPSEIKIRAAMIRAEWDRDTLLSRKVR